MGTVKPPALNILSTSEKMFNLIFGRAVRVLASQQEYHWVQSRLSCSAPLYSLNTTSEDGVMSQALFTCQGVWIQLTAVMKSVPTHWPGVVGSAPLSAQTDVRTKSTKCIMNTVLRFLSSITEQTFTKCPFHNDYIYGSHLTQGADPSNRSSRDNFLLTFVWNLVKWGDNDRPGSRGGAKRRDDQKNKQTADRRGNKYYIYVEFSGEPAVSVLTELMVPRWLSDLHTLSVSSI